MRNANTIELPASVEAKRRSAFHFALANDHSEATNALDEARALVYSAPVMNQRALAHLAVDASRIDLYFGAERANGHSLRHVDAVGVHIHELTLTPHHERCSPYLQTDALCLRGIAGIMQGILHKQAGTEFLEVARQLWLDASRHKQQEPPLSHVILKNQIDRLDFGRLNSMHSGYFRSITRQLVEHELQLPTDEPK